LLADTLHVTPAERTALDDARHSLVAARSVPEGHPTLSPSRPLIGRDLELTRIEHHLAGAETPVLLLAGEPGLGKTRLLQEAWLRAHKMGITVLDAGCYRGAGEPFAPVITALERYISRRQPGELRRVMNGCEWIVHLLPELAELGIEPARRGLLPQQERRLMFRAVAQLLSNIGGPGGTALILDDLQWAGGDAIELLCSLAHGAVEHRLRIVGAYRHTDVSPGDPLATAVADLAHHELLADVLLGPLDTGDASRLLVTLVGHEDVADEEKVLRRAAGVPLFLVSFAAALKFGRLPGIPQDLTQSIRRRVAPLAAGAQEILRIAAVAEQSIHRRVLYVVAQQPEGEILAHLDALLSAGLLVEDGSSAYRFSHDLVREVVEADMGAARGTTLHGRIGAALEELFPGAQVRSDWEREIFSGSPEPGQSSGGR
jgi:predicted ATPase